MVTDDNRAGASVPAYPRRHYGIAIVCGNAWCLPDDYARAQQLYPGASVIAVNGASGHVPAFALFTQHPRKFPQWIEARKRFGNAFTTHAAGKAHLKTKLGFMERMPWVDYWWGEAGGGGTSTWGARRLAGLMGFSEVVLCGMPMEIGSYTGGKMAKHFQDQRVIEHYRKMIMLDKDWHDGVSSMSGWTREIFGGR